MDKAINIEKSRGGGQSLDPKKKIRNYKAEVCHVPDPPCPGCKKEIDFSIFENFQGTGTDWIQWRCKSGCGFFKNVEIL
nr:hypothetical protein [Candidatus Sigynarchaeota archaeon]